MQLKRIFVTSALMLGASVLALGAQESTSGQTAANQPANQEQVQQGNRTQTAQTPEFSSLDTDSSGDLSRAEWAAAADRAAVSRSFAQLDTDNDGEISQSEWRKTSTEKSDQAAASEDSAGGQSGSTDTKQSAEDGGRNGIEADVIALIDWQTDDLYADGTSVDFILDEVEVYGPAGDEIGSVENIVFSRDGRVLSVVAEVGGFWDMFDTHVNVPWEQVELTGNRMTIPVTEENAEDYSLFKTGYLTAQSAGSYVTAVKDDLATGPRAFRASELIGDYARIRDGDVYVNYGYVNDLVIRDNQVAAVVVTPGTAYGRPGPYAYPYYGWGWAAGTPYYDMPYGEQDVAQAEQLDYDRLGN